MMNCYYIVHRKLGRWFAGISVENIGPPRTEEAAIMLKATKGVKYAIYSSGGMELSVPVAR